MNSIFAILSLIVFITYNTYTIAKYGLQPSMSAKWYVLDNPNLFPFALLLFSTLATLSNPTIIMIISTFGISLVGIYTDYKHDKKIKIKHGIGVMIGIGCALLNMVLMGYAELFYILLPGVFILLFIKNHLLWIEIFVYIIIMIPLIFR